MPGKKYVTVGARVTEEEFEPIEKVINRENISVSALVKLLLVAVINGKVQLKNGELKIDVDTHNHADYDYFELDNFGKRVEKKFDRLREREYPESFIDMMKEEILRGIDSRIDMLPKKFDSRKMRNMNEGC
jgi:hypothetical protein